VVDQVWVKSRALDPLPPALFGATPAAGARHPVPGADATNCTVQGGVLGPWWDRLPHFRFGYAPSSGEEIQSEFHVPRPHGVAALRAVHRLATNLQPHLLISEIRTVAADTLWMSPQGSAPTISIHFTWKREPDAVAAVVAAIEDALRPFEARPHWGKVFTPDAALVAALYPRRTDFVELVGRYDSRGALRNEWFEQCISG
jgi:xylitol oxidase